MSKAELLYLPLPSEAGAPLAEDLIEQYLDCLMAPLIGVVPYTQRSRWKQETRFHLDRLREDYEAQGLDPGAAAKQAVFQYGSPDELSQTLLESYFRKKAEGIWVKKFGYGNIVSFATFAGLQILCILVFQLRVLLPSESALNYVVNPALFHSILPESVPLPEFTTLYILSLILTLVSPLVAGWVIGRIVPVKTTRSILNGLLPCLFYTLVAGLLLLPSREVLFFGLAQIVWWLPTAIVVAMSVGWSMRVNAVRRESAEVLS